MTVNAAFDPSCYPSYSTGYADVRIALPYDQTAIGLCHVEDEISIVEEMLTNKVMSDFHGGQSGTPAEMQYMGEMHRIQFRTTTFDRTAFQLLKSRGIKGTRTDSVDGGANAGSALVFDDDAGPGKVTANEIGSFMMNNRSCRLLINFTENEDVRNYWCAIPEQPIEFTNGQKAQEAQFGFLCYPAPCGHRKAGILYDNYSLNAYDNYQIGDAVPTGANP